MTRTVDDFGLRVEEMCLLTLVGASIIHRHATVEESTHFYEEIIKEDCGKCPAKEFCIVCQIEE